MNAPLLKPDELRRRSVECLRLAADMKYQANREMMLAVAQCWLDIADQDEVRAARRNNPSAFFNGASRRRFGP